MKSKDAVPGRMYKLDARDWRPTGDAECVGFNYIGEFMLFLVFDKWGKRRIITVPLTEEVTEIKRK